MRPKLSVSYTHNVSSERNLQGNLRDYRFRWCYRLRQSNYGVADAYQGVQSPVRSDEWILCNPIHRTWCALRFRTGEWSQILTADFTNVIPTAWAAQYVRASVACGCHNSGLLEASVGYLGLARPDSISGKASCDFPWASR